MIQTCETSLHIEKQIFNVIHHLQKLKKAIFKTSGHFHLYITPKNSILEKFYIHCRSPKSFSVIFYFCVCSLSPWKISVKKFHFSKVAAFRRKNILKTEFLIGIFQRFDQLCKTAILQNTSQLLHLCYELLLSSLFKLGVQQVPLIKTNHPVYMKNTFIFIERKNYPLK